MIINEQLIKKMKEVMEMRGFSKWTQESYLSKIKDVMKYFNKPMEKVKIEELSIFLGIPFKKRSTHKIKNKIEKCNCFISTNIKCEQIMN